MFRIMISVDLFAHARRSSHEESQWPETRLRVAIAQYEKFLGLIAEDPRRPVAPTRDIDVIWHLHMLAPRAYQQDCAVIFGETIDHDGGFGQEPEELPALITVFEDTARRWLEKYGEPYEASCGSATKCWHNCQSRCWHACKSEIAA